MQLLITGGAGFIGSNFARRQLKQESKWNRITVIDSLTYAGNLDNLTDCFDHPKFKFYRIDILDTDSLNNILDSTDVVVHFAAESHVDRSIVGAKKFAETNVLGTQNLLEISLVKNVKIFIHVSTDEVYGSIENGSWDELQPVKPNSPYSASKAASDLFALSYFKTFGLDVRVTRCSNNYGPYQHPEKLIPRFITNLLNDKKIQLYGNGLNIREWIHVDDHCKAIELIIENGKSGNIYNVGSNDEVTNLEITHRILDILNLSHSKIEFIEDRKGHDLRYSLNFDKLRIDTGFEPEVKLEFGLKSTVEWYEKNTEWWRKIEK